jgi:GDPmannose 4,6-dehydratase
MKRAIIVGSAGQDGRILFDLLRRRGDLVVGIESGGIACTEPIEVPRVNILDAASVEGIVEKIAPDEIYYLAAYHHSAEENIAETRDLFEKSFSIQVTGLVNFLEAIRRRSPATRFFYASSCRVFGVPQVVPQDETTPEDPDCVYGISKAAGMRCVRFYRQNHSLFAVSGILYNHESPLREAKFVSQKIVHAAVAIQAGRQSKLVLGDLDATVDWGYAPDYAEAMARMLATAAPEDFVVATGEPHTVRQFAETAFGLLGLDWSAYVEVAAGLLTRRPRTYLGCPARLTAATGWKPSVTFPQMVRLLVEAELSRWKTSLGAGENRRSEMPAVPG